MPAAALFGILTSALWTVVGYLVRKVVFQLAIATCLYWFISQAVPIILDKVVPGGMAGNLTSIMQAIPPQLWYILDIMRFDVGLPMVVSAFVARKIMSMIPIIGGK